VQQTIYYSSDKTDPVHVMKACRWSGGTAWLLFDLCTTWGWVVSLMLWPL